VTTETHIFNFALMAEPVLACAADRHLGPYLVLPALAGWAGAEWCRCRACGSTVTRATSMRNAA